MTFFNIETGETEAFTRFIETEHSTQKMDIDIETGEPDPGKNYLKKLKKFSIPKELLKQEKEHNCCIDPNHNFTLTKKEQVINLQEVR